MNLSLRQEQDPPVHPPAIRELRIPVEWMHYCVTCDEQRLFVAREDCDQGLIGKCSHCGETVLARFTRTNSGECA